MLPFHKYELHADGEEVPVLATPEPGATLTVYVRLEQVPVETTT